MRKKIFNIVKIVVTGLLALHVLFLILLQTPFVQKELTSLTVIELKKLFNTELSIGRISYSFPFRLIIDDIQLNDREGSEAIRISRLSAKIDPESLIKEKRITISTAQLFKFDLKIHRPTEESPTNIQFLLEAFAAKDTLKEKSPINLRINSFIIRNGNIAFHTLDKEKTPGKFNTHHLEIRDINAKLSIKSLKTDSLNASVKRLDFKEESGFVLKNLKMKLLADKSRFLLTDFALALPESNIQMDTLRATYDHTATDLIETLYFEGKLASGSYITPRDIAAFFPPVRNFEDRMKLHLAFNGNTRLMEIPYLYVSSENNDVFFLLTDAFAEFTDKDNPYFNANLQNLDITTTGLKFLGRNLSASSKSSPVLSRIGYIQMSGKMEGYLNNLKTNLTLMSGIGDIKADLQTDKSLKNGLFTYSSTISSPQIDLHQLFGEESGFGNMGMNINLSGELKPSTRPTLYIKGSLPTLQYNQYEYSDIGFDGTFNGNKYDGKLTLNDENIAMEVNGGVVPKGETPIFNLRANLNHFRPEKLHLTNSHQGCEYSLKLNACFSGNDFNNVSGKINIDSLYAIVPDDVFYLENINIKAEQNRKTEKCISIQSDFIQAHIEGLYDYKTLPQSFTNILADYLPSLIQKKKTKKNRKNDFRFSLTLNESKFYPYVLDIPLTINPSATFKGHVTEEKEEIKIVGYFPTVKYDTEHYENGMLLCENRADGFHADLRFSKQMEEGAWLTMAFRAKAQNDNLNTHFSWGNDTDITYAGEIEANTRLKQSTHGNPPRADIHISPSEIILNDTVWNLHESTVTFDSGRISTDKLLIDHETGHLHIAGVAGPNPEDSLTIALERIKLEYIFDILQFHPVDFTGKASGNAVVKGALKEPQADAKLYVEDFTFNGGLMGNMHLKGGWDHEIGVILDADIKEESHPSHTLVKGYVSPKEKKLDLQIQANQTNLAFLNSFVGSIFKDVRGRATGDIHLHGPFKALCLEGKALADASAYAKILGTRFSFQQDSIHLEYDRICFNEINISDPAGGTAKINGTLSHEHLGNMRYDFKISAQNFLIFNGDEKDESLPFHGSIYGTGNATLKGGNGILQVSGNMRTNPGTVFIYNAGSPEEITNTDFVTFRDKTPRPQQYELPELFRKRLSKEKEEEKSNPLDIYINVNVDATSDAVVKVILDPMSGDYVSAHGNGNIAIDFHNKGDLTMQGVYTATDGIYKMSMQDVIRKEFLIQPGSKVSFTGNPYHANLDLKAAYTVNSASLSDLIPDASFNQNTVKVNCLVLLSGLLSSPNLAFDIELPTVNEEEQQMVRSAISTEEQMRTQFIYLLGIGKFYTYDYANYANYQSSNAMSSLLSSTLSGQLNSILSQALNMSNWNFASNFSTGQEGWSDLEVEGILSGRLLNNRLLINGAFGYRENQLTNSNFVGDFNIQWLLTPSGDLSLKAYNMTNDRYFAKTTFNTQGIGMMYKRDFNRWSDIFKSRKKKKKERITSLNEGNGN